MAQISDSHLFADRNGLHHGHNVLANLKKVLLSIKQTPEIGYVVFTGDLTQDHTEESYQHFVTAVHECKLSIPIYYLAGNHDEKELFAKHFSVSPFESDTTIEHPHWQVQLINSKSNTPSGFVSENELKNLGNMINKDKQQLLMMHHHPIDVGYFIDKHGLENKTQFWQEINQHENIEAIACGHVHRAMTLTQPLANSIKNRVKDESRALNNPLILYTCPATSIQFDPNFDGVSALEQGPAYRIFYLYPDGKLKTDVITL